MKKQNLIQFCHFYNGEESNPFKDQNKRMLWHYELSWINDMSNNDDEFISIQLDEYIRSGLGYFEYSDGVPMTLKAYLFNRYAKGSQSLAEAVEPFKKFYSEYYTKGSV